MRNLFSFRGDPKNNSEADKPAIIIEVPEDDGHLSEALRALGADSDRLVESAFLPITAPAPSLNDQSGFGGTPWVDQDNPHPVCDNCHKFMPLFLQLRFDSLPSGFSARGTGLLQMFYCTSSDPTCELDLDGWAPFSRVTHLRTFEPKNGSSSGETANSYPAQRITGWNMSPELPSWEELGSLAGEDLVDSIDDEILENIPNSSMDKLGGWPFWVQSIEYPKCPECDQVMTMLFQIASEDHVPYMFGDVGVGHITQCSIHPQVLAFGWACS